MPKYHLGRRENQLRFREWGRDGLGAASPRCPEYCPQCATTGAGPYHKAVVCVCRGEVAGACCSLANAVPAHEVAVGGTPAPCSLASLGSEWVLWWWLLASQVVGVPTALR